MNVIYILDYILSNLEKICAILAWSLNIEFYISPMIFATPLLVRYQHSCIKYVLPYFWALYFSKFKFVFHSIERILQWSF